MHYRNFNLLPHVLSYIFCQFTMVWGLFETVYHALLSNLQKKMYINIFKKKTMVTCGNPLQIVPQTMLNWGKKYVNPYGNALKLC